MQSAIFSSEDREFMDAVHLDLNLFTKGENLKSDKAVLVFPPFNNFKRFLVHKIVEDTYNSTGLSTFSIGQDFQRRIIVCHSALKLRLTSLQETTKLRSLADKEKEEHTRSEMIDKDCSKPRATANIYRPPAARSPANASNSKLEHESHLNKRSRVRRPDLKVYVPRPKRASYGEIDKSRSPPRNVDKTVNIRQRRDERRMSLDSSVVNLVNLTKDDDIISTCCDKGNNKYETLLNNSVTTDSAYENKNLVVNRDVLPLGTSSNSDRPPYLFNKSNLENSYLDVVENKSSNSTDMAVANNSRDLMEDKPTETVSVISSSDKTNVISNEVSKIDFSTSKPSSTKNEEVCSSNIGLDVEKVKHNILCNNPKTKSDSVICQEIEDVLTISDDSQSATNSDDVISISSTITESSSEDSFDSSDSSSPKRQPIKKCKHDKYLNESSKSDNKLLQQERTNTSGCCERKDDEKDLNSEERNLKNRRILHGKPASDVLIISDTAGTQEKLSVTRSSSENPLQSGTILKENSKSSGKVVDKQCTYNLDDYDWDALFTDDGECLVPEFVDELTKSVGRVKITTAKSDYRPFQTDEERRGDGESIIEIYDFPVEFKTNDLFNIFASYCNRGFHIKWVDDTHALGVFNSPLVADEVLATNLPFVKTRPLRHGIAESRMKARSLVLPPMERPKTCPALARRLVTGALGLKLPNASKEREAEKLVLKEAREKRRQVAKQREAAWEGTFN